MAVAAGRDVVNHTVVLQFHWKVIPIPAIYILSAKVSYEGLEGEPATFGERLAVPPFLNPPVSADPALLSALHYATPYPTLCLLVYYLPSPLESNLRKAGCVYFVHCYT